MSTQSPSGPTEPPRHTALDPFSAPEMPQAWGMVDPVSGMPGLVSDPRLAAMLSDVDRVGARIQHIAAQERAAVQEQAERQFEMRHAAPPPTADHLPGATAAQPSLADLAGQAHQPPLVTDPRLAGLLDLEPLGQQVQQLLAEDAAIAQKESQQRLAEAIADAQTPPSMPAHTASLLNMLGQVTGEAKGMMDGRYSMDEMREIGARAAGHAAAREGHLAADRIRHDVMQDQREMRDRNYAHQLRQWADESKISGDSHLASARDHLSHGHGADADLEAARHDYSRADHYASSADIYDPD